MLVSGESDTKTGGAEVWLLVWGDCDTKTGGSVPIKVKEFYRHRVLIASLNCTLSTCHNESLLG